jgi:hypothetical protein
MKLGIGFGVLLASIVVATVNHRPWIGLLGFLGLFIAWKLETSEHP